MANLVVTSYAFGQTRVGDTEFRAAFDATTMLLETGTGTCETFEIFLAVKPVQRKRGLMFVQSMLPTQGMLFQFAPQTSISMYMKNTVIPLDIVFLDNAGAIINIAEDTEPYSLTSIRAAGPATFALELNAGRTAELGLKPGQTLFRPDLTALQ
ncbi:MAG: DUF192 domain-containing protein [Pseudomonadota bacterium]